MDNKPLPREKKLRTHSSELRRQATKEENHLWYDFLRGCPAQFNRQRIIGSYIVDFYCARAKLVIELDGSQHFEEDAIQYDDARTRYLESLGLTVLRFSNLDINRNFREVCQSIDWHVKRQLSQPASR